MANPPQIHPNPGGIAPPQPSSVTLADAVEMTFHRMKCKVYVVLDAQMNELLAGYNSLHLLFFGVFLGATVSLWIAFAETAKDAGRYYYFNAAVATSLGAIYSGIVGLVNFLKALKRRNEIYANAVPLEIDPRAAK